MKLIIDIEDNIYEEVKNSKSVPDINGITIVNCMEAIKNGTPFPKSSTILEANEE